MKHLNISLLGGFTVTLDNQPLTKFRSAKSRALLAYLAMQPDQDHPRANLAALLWGDLPETAAKTNLRVELSHLKKLLQASGALTISRQTVRLEGTAVTVDAADLLQSVQTFLILPDESQRRRRPALDRAVASYQGEFLAGFHLPDNWDHLVGAAEAVVGGLQAETAVHVLATSRRRLNAPNERVYPLAGLPTAAGVELFIDRARRLLPDFARDRGETAVHADIAAVCQQVRGLPLGIELAASWVEHFTVADIGASLADIAVEPQEAAALADRHHSLDAVLTYSWQLLSPDQQQILARLSLFQGGFNRRAAEVVAESSLSDLSILLGHSLIQRVAAGRYDLHPLVREWTEAQVCFDHVEALTETAADPHLYVNAVERLIRIPALHFRGDFAQGLVRLESLLPVLDAIPNPTMETEYLRSQVRSSLTTVGFRYGAYDLALRYARQNLTWARGLGHQQELSGILLELALTELFAGLLPEAVAHNEEALALARGIGATDDEGLLQANLCLTLRQRGELAKALAYGQTAVTILRRLGLVRMVGQALNRVGHTQLALGQPAEAYDTYGQALQVWDQLQHHNQYEAMAGRAAAALALGKDGEAMQLAEEVLAFTVENGLMGIVEPALLFLYIEQVQTGLGQTAAAHETLQRAQSWIETIAGRIEDTAVRDAFLQRPDNRKVRLLLAEGEAAA